MVDCGEPGFRSRRDSNPQPLTLVQISMDRTRLKLQYKPSKIQVIWTRIILRSKSNEILNGSAKLNLSKFSWFLIFFVLRWVCDSNFQFDTYDSRVVPHLSTRQAQWYLTSEFGWDLVIPPCSLWKMSLILCLEKSAQTQRDLNDLGFEPGHELFWGAPAITFWWFWAPQNTVKT